MPVVEFPAAAARANTKRARLVAYLRELADEIEADNVEAEPTAALVVISGPQIHEVVCCGYGDDAWGYEEASEVAGYVARDHGFPTIGGNQRNRGDYVGRPMQHSNIVDGAFPRPLPATPKGSPDAG